MAVIDKRTNSKGEITYRVRIRIKGYPTRVETFPNKTQATRWAQQEEARMREGRHFKAVEARKRTVGELLDRYSEDLLPRRGRDRQTVEGQLKWWKAQLGAYMLSDVTTPLVNDCINKLAKEPIKLKDEKKPPKYRTEATQVRYIATLSVCFTYAVKDLCWMDENPIRKVRKPSLSNERDRYLTHEERKRLLEACKAYKKNRFLHPVVVLALTTGARQGEILNLKWKDIDLSKPLMRLEQTKNKEKRTVPLSGEAVQLLLELKKVRQLNSDYLFPREDGKKPFEIKKHWKAVVAEAELTNFKFHDLRHTAASYLAMTGATPLEIAHVLGHKQMKMVKRYAHLSDPHTVQVLERMNQWQFQQSIEATAQSG